MRNVRANEHTCFHGAEPVDVGDFAVSKDGAQSKRDEATWPEAAFDSSKLAVVASETSDSVIITDCEFTTQWANAAARRVTGYSAEELLGRNLLDVAGAPTLAPDLVTQMRNDLLAGRRFAAVSWALRKNSERILVEFEVLPYFNASGEVTAFIGISRDITTKAAADQALRASEEHFRDAQKLAGVGSWRFILDKNEIHWSEEIFRAFGRKLTEGPPTLDEYFAYMRPADSAQHRETVGRALQYGEPYESSYTIDRSDGTKAIVNCRGNVRRDSAGRIIELYGTTQDVTARAAAEQERLNLQARLAETQRFESLSRLAGGIAHDFNNLLMGVMMDASVLEREVASNSRAADAAASLRHAAQRMAERTNQLLAYAGRGRFVAERINPNELAAHELRSLQQTLPAATEFEARISAVPATVEIDSNQLRGALMNLIANAVDALEGRPGKISVRTAIESPGTEAATWVLEVRDSGVGMTEETRLRVFEPFFTTKEIGRGLGLSTVHGIVQRSGGNIEIRSTPNAGTTFMIRLPLKTTTPDFSIRDHAPAENRPLRVLVADDEALVRRGLRRMLELDQMTVVDVSDGAAAIEVLQKADVPFDVALVDVMMPKKTGYDVLAEMRTRNLPTKIILMSGFNDIDELANAKVTGYHADAMLQKPFAWDELKQTVHRVMQWDTSSFPDKR